MSVDNLEDEREQDHFKDLIHRRKPDVVVVGGLTINTAKLASIVKDILERCSEKETDTWSGHGPTSRTPVIYVHDEVARIYQHSDRANEEVVQQPTLVAKYCVGLARYVQNPLNEYASLGADLTAITFDEVAQPLVSFFCPSIILVNSHVHVTRFLRKNFSVHLNAPW